MIRDLETDVHLSLVPVLDEDSQNSALGHTSSTDDGRSAALTPPEPLRVVIVDDAPSTRRFLRAVLEHCSDFDVAGEAADGDTAIEQAKALQPDLVLLDVAMPTVNGATALKGILGAAPNAIVIVVSGLNPAVGEQLLNDGAAAFVPKGMAPYDLLDRLGTLLGRSITVRQANQDSSDRVDSTEPAEPSHSKRRAVVFDGDPLIRHVITQVLTESGVDVVAESTTAATVLAVVDLAQPELVVLDLPSLGSPTSILGEICRRSPHSVVVVYSAMEHWREDAISAGAAAFICKPRIDELADRVRQLIARS